jgi:putative transposase
MKKQYSAKQKAQIVLEILKEERSIAQLAAEHGIHPNQLYRWKAQAMEGLPGLEYHKTDEVKRRMNGMEELAIGRLNTQLVLKKSV